MSDVIGLVAACLTTISFVPQALLVVRTRMTAGISLSMYALFTAGIALWLVYGVMIGAWPIIIANLITICLASVILGMKLRAVLQRQPSTQGAAEATSAPIAS